MVLPGSTGTALDPSCSPPTSPRGSLAMRCGLMDSTSNAGRQSGRRLQDRRPTVAAPLAVTGQSAIMDTSDTSATPNCPRAYSSWPPVGRLRKVVLVPPPRTPASQSCRCWCRPRFDCLAVCRHLRPSPVVKLLFISSDETNLSSLLGRPLLFARQQRKEGQPSRLHHQSSRLPRDDDGPRRRRRRR